MKSINMNETVKVKLTPIGVNIYYHQYDNIIFNGVNLMPPILEIDNDGFTSFQLWRLMELYGPYIHMGWENPFDPIEIYFNGETN